MPELRKLSFVLLVSILLFGLSGADAQINRSGIKKSNKRVGSYKGTINSFGKQNIYNSLGFSLIAINYYGDLSPNPGKKAATSKGTNNRKTGAEICPASASMLKPMQVNP